MTHSPASLPLFWCRFTWGDARVRFRRSVANRFLVVRRLTALSYLAMPASFALSCVAGRAAEGEVADEAATRRYLELPGHFRDDA